MLFQKRSQVRRLAHQRRLAGEGEQLPREVGGAIGELHDVFEEFADRARDLRLAQGEGGVALDAGEQVVEFMGDAPRQRADALHFLRLHQLPMHLLVLGDVAIDADEVGHLPADVEDRGKGEGGIEQRAVLALVDELSLPAAAFVEGAPNFADEVGGLPIAVEKLAGVLAEHFDPAEAEHAFQGAVDVEHDAVQIGDEDAVARRFEGGDERIVGVLQAMARNRLADALGQLGEIGAGGIAHDVIESPFAQDLRRQLLVAVGGDHQDGRVIALFAQAV